jgi:hypothetical protein
MKYYSTPGTPRFNIVRPNEEIKGVNESIQPRYRSDVEILLYLINIY